MNMQTLCGNRSLYYTPNMGVKTNPGDLYDLISQVQAEQQSLHSILQRLVERDTAEVDSIMFEYDSAPPNTTGSNGGFRAQTNDTEVIEGILVILPPNTTSATLLIGEQISLPIQNTYTLLTPLRWVVSGQRRNLTYAPANSTMGSTIVIWGHAAPRMVPGVLHP